MEDKRTLKNLRKLQHQCEVPLDDIEKMQSLHITLVHPVPPQHQIEITGSHVPTQKSKKLFEKYGPIRKGSFTPVEDGVIRKNWGTFCMLHDWNSGNVEPFLGWRHNGKYYISKLKERQKFVQFLANGLPWRTLYSVYSRFKILYRNKISHVRYTLKEDEIILTHMQSKHLNKQNSKYNELAKLLGRTVRSIAKRYRYLKNHNNKMKEQLTGHVKWTLPMIKKFIKTLLCATLSDNIEELRNATLLKPVWQKMEKELKLKENVLKTFWYNQLHLQLFSTRPIYLNDIKIQLIEYIYGKGISSKREIIWPNVARYFDGATAVFLCKIFYYLVQECNVKDTDDFIDIVEHLYHTKIPEIREACTDRCLPRIIYQNGKINILNVENRNDEEVMSDNSN